MISTPAVIHPLLSLIPKRANGVGENKKPTVPNGRAKNPEQNNTTDRSDNVRHLMKEIPVNVF
ncbi:MAG: hypothetical protein LBQ90_01685 [Synergistaceae bacterium]|jgi:hypothetical protein|nr:hypothetical protein [Synergistaceae bacterium]